MNPGRNNPCPCGSSKKFKRCCGVKRKQVQVQDKNKEAHQLFIKGNAFIARGEIAIAIDHFQHALLIKPDYFEAHHNLANSLIQLGKTELAVDHFYRALSIRKNPHTHFDLGNALVTQGKPEKATFHFEEALELNPDFAEAHNNLGNMTRRSRGPIQAIEHFKQAINLKPDFAEAHNNLSLALLAQGDINRAIFHFEQALKHGPEYTAAHNNLLFALNYSPNHDPEDIYSAHASFAKEREIPSSFTIYKYAINPTEERRLRIGYVSSDFRQHSVSHFIEPVLECHDRDKFEIFCYYNLAIEDAVTKRLKSKTEHWISIANMPDNKTYERISKDKIDILIDLNGHTTNNRLILFSMKPAPIQATWLGYPNTTGLSAIDYRITDKYADPIGLTEKYHSEKLLRLPECFSCYKPPSDSPDVSVLPATANGYITFGSFNKLAKINQEVIVVWADLLKAIPDSRLVLKTTVFIEKAMQEYIMVKFGDLGITPERLQLLGPNTGQKQHLKQYNNIDIGLDPFPYNGTTTTCEALWMGVPVITLAGRSHAGRVGLSQMKNLRLADFVCSSHQEYINTAIRLSSDLTYLDNLRKCLRSRMISSPLMDASRLTKNLEHAFVDIWNQRYRNLKNS